MTWSTPPTWVPGQSIPSANLNILRDDLLETAVAKATTSGSHFAATGPFALAERRCTQDTNNGSGTTTSTSYTNTLSGGGTTPTVTVTTGALALSFAQAQMSNSGSSASFIAVDVSGATTSGAVDENAALHQGDAGDDFRSTVMNLHSLTAGSNVFKIQYKANGGTLTCSKRNLVVFPL